MERARRSGAERGVLGLEEEEAAACSGPSAAAASSLLATLATGQCGAGGGVLGSNLYTISL